VDNPVEDFYRHPDPSNGYCRRPPSSEGPQKAPEPERHEQYVDHQKSLFAVLRNQTGEPTGRGERFPKPPHILLDRVRGLRKNERATGLDFKEVMGKDHADSFLLLESGRADAFVMDGQILAGNISKSKNPAGFKIVGEVLSVEPIACMLRKDDPAFLKAVDDSIKRQIADGSLAKLYDKWFMQPIPPTNTKVGLPLSEATKAAWASPNNRPMEDYAKK